MVTEGALPGETAAHFSATWLAFSSGSVVGAASPHSRNGFLISNRPRSPADQPSEECAAKIRKSCCSSTIACSFLTGHSTPCRVEVTGGARRKSGAEMSVAVGERSGAETCVHGSRDILMQQGCIGSKQVQMLVCECGLQSAAYSGRRGMGERQGESHRSH